MTQKAVLNWAQTLINNNPNYPQVRVSNNSTSWQDGLGFCALIHCFHPEAFDFSSLKASDRLGNLKLAFATAEKFGVPALLDAEDILSYPDSFSITTYLIEFHKRFGAQNPRVDKSPALQNPRVDKSPALQNQLQHSNNNPSQHSKEHQLQYSRQNQSASSVETGASIRGAISVVKYPAPKPPRPVASSPYAHYDASSVASSASSSQSRNPNRPKDASHKNSQKSQMKRAHFASPSADDLHLLSTSAPTGPPKVLVRLCAKCGHQAPGKFCAHCGMRQTVASSRDSLISASTVITENSEFGQYYADRHSNYIFQDNQSQTSEISAQCNMPNSAQSYRGAVTVKDRVEKINKADPNALQSENQPLLLSSPSSSRKKSKLPEDEASVPLCPFCIIV